MKIILSRKGFDSANGVCPNPIFPDGTMLSFPIPSKDELSYGDIAYDGKSYLELLSELNPKMEYTKCHLDPDIRRGLRKNEINDWKPAFGQINQSETYLRNAGVKADDLFLFFGRFQNVIKDQEGKWRFDRKSPIKHIIYGYLQVEKILMEKEEIEKYYWHPHASREKIDNPKNSLYIPTEKLKFNSQIEGYGVWNYDEKRVLTMDGATTATWKEYEFLRPGNVVGNRKNSAKSKGIYYAGIWQELVINESEQANEWAIGLFG